MSATEHLLAYARGRIARYEPRDAQASARANGSSVIVDLRSHDERARDGVIPGSVHVPRSVLEWRVDPASGYLEPAQSPTSDIELILVCHRATRRASAAVSLRGVGHTRVADVVGGYHGLAGSRARDDPGAAAAGRAAGHGRTGPVIDRDRLVADALAAVSIPSFTGSEEAMAGMDGRPVPGARARRAVAAGRGRTRERARTRAGTAAGRR